MCILCRDGTFVENSYPGYIVLLCNGGGTSTGKTSGKYTRTPRDTRHVIAKTSAGWVNAGRLARARSPSNAAAVLHNAPRTPPPLPAREHHWARTHWADVTAHRTTGHWRRRRPGTRRALYRMSRRNYLGYAGLLACMRTHIFIVIITLFFFFSCLCNL